MERIVQSGLHKHLPFDPITPLLQIYPEDTCPHVQNNIQKVISYCVICKGKIINSLNVHLQEMGCYGSAHSRILCIPEKE